MKTKTIFSLGTVLMGTLLSSCAQENPYNNDDFSIPNVFNGFFYGIQARFHIPCLVAATIANTLRAQSIDS